jgi:hypothetical protein
MLLFRMDPKAMLWNSPCPPPRVPRPGELLFEFVRASDRAPMSSELRFHVESYGWEAQIFERGELFYSRGGFALRAQAIAWAEAVRRATSRSSWKNVPMKN